MAKKKLWIRSVPSHPPTQKEKEEYYCITYNAKYGSQAQRPEPKSSSVTESASYVSEERV